MLTDTPTTEKLDYFSAALTILYALYFTVVRLFHLYQPKHRHRLIVATATPSPQGSSSALKMWTFVCGVTFVVHVSYLTFLPRFDYTYNIIINIAVGLMHNALWLVYALPAELSILRRFPSQPKTYRPSFVSSAATLVALTTAATALELFDFPAIGRILDAHALWHLSTAPIALYWYRFLLTDALEIDSSRRVYKG